MRKDIALVEEQENGSISFRFLEGINDGVIYPSKLNIKHTSKTKVQHGTRIIALPGLHSL